LPAHDRQPGGASTSLADDRLGVPQQALRHAPTSPAAVGVELLHLGVIDDHEAGTVTSRISINWATPRSPRVPQRRRYGCGEVVVG
jgi:hypothetical protein